jgi:hypothetical protein
MTCCLKARSETSRLLRAMWIWRELMERPQPWVRLWRKPRVALLVVEGLKLLRSELLEVPLVLKLRENAVPVRKA